MKTERRHALETNILADWLGHKIDAIRPYRHAITATVVGVIVVLSLLAVLRQRSAARQARLWDRYYAAIEEYNRTGSSDMLRDVASADDSAAAALMSRLNLADIHLEKGINELFTDRTVARSELNAALEDYTHVQTHGRVAMLRERALLGMARANESLNNLDQARHQYREVVTRWPDSPSAKEAQRRLSDLDRMATRQFYDWFALQNPQSPLSGMPGHPGMPPSSQLPDDEAMFRLPLGGGPDRPDDTNVAPLTLPDVPSATNPPGGAPPEGDSRDAAPDKSDGQ